MEHVTLDCGCEADNNKNNEIKVTMICFRHMELLIRNSLYGISNDEYLSDIARKVKIKVWQ